MNKIFGYIKNLIDYGIENNLIDKDDKIYIRNEILSQLNLDEYIEPIENTKLKYVEDILDNICSWAVETNLIEDTLGERELFDTKIMGILTKRPSEVIREFKENYKINPEKATDVFYKFSKKNNYIREKRIGRNLHWYWNSEFGNLEITVNLAKPEKDPRDIEREGKLKKSAYPKCLLCKENIGYKGRGNHPARQNLRVIPLELCGKKWNLQYSPYVYYNEHSIIFSDIHEPMKIGRETFERIVDFLDFLPHYFIGSNADLPIVGGSILSHDHYQGGKHEFPMAKSKIEKSFQMEKFPDIECGRVKWPMSVIRIRGKNKTSMIEASEYILKKWREYEDLNVEIKAYTEKTPHNTITPIGRKKDNIYEMDLVLRNNKTTDEYPMGIFHPHEEVHNIKKENIGLIEVMGLAVLPGRLHKEMEDLIEISKKKEWEEIINKNENLIKHKNWLKNILQNNEKITKKILEEEIGKIFEKVLEHAGVFKRDEKGIRAFDKFLENLNK